MGGGGGVVVGSGGGLVSSSWRRRSLVGGSLSLACGLALAGLHWQGYVGGLAAVARRHWSRPDVVIGSLSLTMAAGSGPLSADGSAAGRRHRQQLGGVICSPSLTAARLPQAAAAARRHWRQRGVVHGGSVSQLAADWWNPKHRHWR